MIEILEKRKAEGKIGNLQIKKVDSDHLPLGDAVCDMVIMITVLHEIEKKDIMLAEIKRILKKEGRLLIVEFHKEQTPMGPPSEHRISEEETSTLCSCNGFEVLNNFHLGENIYAIVFKAGSK